MNHVRVFATEISAILGKHGFKTCDEALVSIWKRTHKNNYYKALSLLPCPKLDDKLFEIMLKFEEKSHNADYLIAVPEIKNKMIKAKELYSSFPGTKTSTEELVEIKILINESSDLTEERRKDLCDEAEKIVFTSIGKTLEEQSLNIHESKTGTKISRRNEYSYRLKISELVTISGRIDGFDEIHGIVVEHKQRQYKLLDNIPEREIIQVIVYMKLVNCERGKLVQTFKNLQRHTTIYWPGEDHWNKMLAEILAQMKRLEKLIVLVDEFERTNE